MSVCSSVCVPTRTYFASICKAWKSETQGGPLRKYTDVCRNKHTHTDSSLALRAVCINACSNGCRSNNSEAWGSDRYPRAHPLTLDRWTRLLFFPPLPAFMGPLIMLTRHIKIKLSMQCLWYGEEVSWSDAIKSLSLRSSPVIWRPEYGRGEVKVKVQLPPLSHTDCLTCPTTQLLQCLIK